MKLGLYLRSISFELGRVLLTLFFSVVGQLFWLAPYPLRYAFLTKWTVLTLAWLRFTCGLRFEVEGAEHIDATKPSVVMAHHESAWETMAMQLVFPRQTYVLKKELMRIPFFGWTIAMLNPIAIDRSAGRAAMRLLLEQGAQRLQQRGDWLVIYPEGTRVPTGTIGKINKGAASLALKLAAPIYLVTHNAGAFWPKNSLLKKPGVITVKVSPPLNPQGMTVEQINQAVLDWYQQN